MYVIQRTDKEYGTFTKAHKTLDEAQTEAERLATKHVIEAPSFTIYKLEKVKVISAKVAIMVSEN